MRTLITGAFHLTEQQYDTLRAMGLVPTFQQNERDPVAEPEQYELILCNGLFQYTTIERFTALRIVQLASVGYDRIDLDYTSSHGIRVFNAKDVYSVPMAEFAICGILDLYKQSRFFWENQRAHQWKKHRGILELAKKRVCIVGTGDVGCQIAKRLKTFDCCITGVNRTPKQQEGFDCILPLSMLSAACSDSDIVILCIALTAETAALVRSCIPTSMKTGSILVNLARGGLVDTLALTEALQNGKLSGAVLDVFEEEPLPKDSLLWDGENVILTPHNSFVGDGNERRMWEVILNDLRGVL